MATTEKKTAEQIPPYKIEIIENPFVVSAYPSKKQWGIKFTIGVQSFTLSIQRSKKDAQWFAEQLRRALNNLTAEYARIKCAEQREICAEALTDTNFNIDYNTGECHIDKSSILNAKEPEL